MINTQACDEAVVDIQHLVNTMSLILQAVKGIPAYVSLYVVGWVKLSLIHKYCVSCN